MRSKYFAGIFRTDVLLSTLLLTAMLHAACSATPSGASSPQADASAKDIAHDGASRADSGRDTVDVGDSPHTVATAQGPVAGVESDGVLAFKAIPYAAAPVGELRWKPPRQPLERAGVLTADQFGPACPQVESRLVEVGRLDEDCLTLNVWTQKDRSAGARPVMVWFHGGGFLQGSSGQQINGTRTYDGQDLAREGVVVVTVNYRLGAFGFLAHEAFIAEDDHQAAGNYGLLDQIRALEWVRNNIENFGGAPDNITIFGESAGGTSVCALMTSPLTAGMFNRAIMQSGNCLEKMRHLREARAGTEAAVTQGQRFAEAIGCAQSDDVAACMRAKPAADVLEALPASAGFLDSDELFEPIIDTHVLEKTMAASLTDGSAHPVPFIIGANADEGTLFTQSFRLMSKTRYHNMVQTYFPLNSQDVLAMYPADAYDAPWRALSALVTDLVFICPTRRTARAHRASGNPAFTYYFTHITDAGRLTGLGAFHSAEIAFVFGNFNPESTQSEEATLSAKMQTWWTQFARAGAPGAAAGVDWPIYDRVGDPWMRLAAGESAPTTDVRKSHCDFWDANP